MYLFSVPNASTSVTNYYNSLVSGRQRIFDGKASQLSSSFPSNNIQTWNIQTNPTPPSNVLCNICNQSLDSVKSYHKHLIASHPENAVEVLCAGKNADYNCFVVKSLSLYPSLFTSREAARSREGVGSSLSGIRRHSLFLASLPGYF